MPKRNKKEKLSPLSEAQVVSDDAQVEKTADKEPRTEPKKEKISDEELAGFNKAKQKLIKAMTVAENAMLVAEKANLEAKTAELEAKNLMLMIFNNYGLSFKNGDNLLDDGTIRRAVLPPELEKE